jgi:hypothetical protein
MVEPAQMLPTLPAKGHAPSITCKPGMFVCSFAYGNGARAGDEGLEITFDSRGVDENMTVPTTQADEMI